MSRVERFRQTRKLRIKIIASFLFFFALITCGLYLTDFSINNLMRNENKVRIISIKNYDTSYIQISLLGQDFFVNSSYVSRDFHKFKKVLEGVLPDK